MPSLFTIDPTETAESIATILNEVEQQVWTDSEESLLLSIPATGPNAHRICLLTAPGAKAPVGGIEVETFDPALDSDAVAGKVAEIEDARALELRFCDLTTVAGQVQWLAVFDPKPKSIPKAATDRFLRLEGRISHFGGPGDFDMAQFEDTAFVFNNDTAKDYPGFFLPANPLKPTGFGRRLRVEKPYIACRWEELGTPLPRKFLRLPTTLCTLINPQTGARVEGVRPIDFGPAARLGRVADVSPSVEEALGLKTDELAVVLIPLPGGAAAVIPKEEKPALTAPNGKRRAVMLTGSYANRARVAAQKGCTLTVDFHFNSADGPAFGPEVFFKTGDARAKKTGSVILDAMRSLGLKDTRAEPLKGARGTRASYIQSYPSSSVLLEPLFISEIEQSRWIKRPENLTLLAEHVGQAIFAQTTEEDLIGLSIGHLGNTARPGDQGAAAKDGGVETDFNAPMAEKIFAFLTT